MAKKTNKKFDAPLKNDERTNEELHAEILALADTLDATDAANLRELANRFETACRQLSVIHKPAPVEKFKVWHRGEPHYVTREVFEKLNPGGKVRECNEAFADKVLSEANPE